MVLSQVGLQINKENGSVIGDSVNVVEYVIGLIGGDLVDIRIDASESHARPGAFLECCNEDKKYAQQLKSCGSEKVAKPLGKLEWAVAWLRGDGVSRRFRRFWVRIGLKYLWEICGEEDRSRM